MATGLVQRNRGAGMDTVSEAIDPSCWKDVLAVLGRDVGDIGC